jgi:hypothetical protein
MFGIKIKIVPVNINSMEKTSELKQPTTKFHCKVEKENRIRKAIRLNYANVIRIDLK